MPNKRIAPKPPKSVGAPLDPVQIDTVATGIYDQCHLCSCVYSNITGEIEKHLHGVCTVHSCDGAIIKRKEDSISRCDECFETRDCELRHIEIPPVIEPVSPNLFEDSDEEAIVEECWKELRRASRKNRNKRRFQHLKNSRKGRKDVIDDEDKPHSKDGGDFGGGDGAVKDRIYASLAEGSVLNEQNINKTTEDKSLNENKELKLTVSEENAEGSSPGPDKILFLIPPDIIYADQSLPYGKYSAGFAPSNIYEEVKFPIDGSFGESDDDLDASSTDFEDDFSDSNEHEPVYQTISESHSKDVLNKGKQLTQMQDSTEKEDSDSRMTIGRGLSGGLRPVRSEKRSTGQKIFVPADEASKMVDIRSLQQPTLLFPHPDNLTEAQIKRRLVVQTLLDSENSYVETLKRLVFDYQKPLEESSPPIVSLVKIKAIFSCLGAILRCHTMFRVGLLGAMSKWEEQEKIGDALCGFLSSSILLDVYSQYVNNFSYAMDLARKCANAKPPFSKFLKERQSSYPDRLPFFGLMIKPVQRFPQYIMILQDLIKCTPKSHADHIPLMRAFAMLENLAEILNYKKLVSEQQLAALDVQRFSTRKLRLLTGFGYPRLIMQTPSMELTMTDKGLVSHLKPRILILFDSCLICARSIDRSFDFGNCILPNQNIKRPVALHIKWCYPLNHVHLITQKKIGAQSSQTSLNSYDSSDARKLCKLEIQLESPSSNQHPIVNAMIVNFFLETSSPTSLPLLFNDLSNLIHDFAIVRNIGFLVSALKGEYEGLNSDIIQQLCAFIKERMKHINEAISLMDKSRIQLVLPPKTKDSLPVKTMFQLADTSTKHCFIHQIQSASLSYSQSLKPSWDFPAEQSHLLFLEPPNYVKRSILLAGESKSQMLMACLTESESLLQLWSVIEMENNKLMTVFNLVPNVYDITVKLQYQKELPNNIDPLALSLVGESVVLISKDKALLHWSINKIGEHEEKLTSVDASPCCATSSDGNLIIGCDSGKIVLLSFCENVLTEQKSVMACTMPVTCVTVGNNSKLYAAAENTVFIFAYPSLEHEACYQLDSLSSIEKGIRSIAVISSTLWVAFTDSPILKLYDLAGLRHLQDLDVSVSVKKSLTGNLQKRTAHAVVCADLTSRVVKEICVTVMGCTGNGLWVGTNVGITVLYPLPRLGGLPVINGPGMVAYYGHVSSVTFIGVSSNSSSNDTNSISNNRADDDTLSNCSELSEGATPTPPTPPVRNKFKEWKERRKDSHDSNDMVSLHSHAMKWDSLMSLPLICETELEDLGDLSPVGEEAQEQLLQSGFKTETGANVASPIEKAQHLLNDSFGSMFENRRQGKPISPFGKLFNLGTRSPSGAPGAHFAEKLVKFSVRRASKDTKDSNSNTVSTISSPVDGKKLKDSGYNSFTNFDNYIRGGFVSRKQNANSARQFVITGGTGCLYWPENDKLTHNLNNACITIWELR